MPFFINQEENEILQSSAHIQHPVWYCNLDMHIFSISYVLYLIDLWVAHGTLSIYLYGPLV